jgi:hypothetical protein
MPQADTAPYTCAHPRTHYVANFISDSNANSSPLDYRTADGGVRVRGVAWNIR